MVTTRFIPTFRTDMNSFTLVFLARMSTTFRANLAGIFVVNLSQILALFPTYPRQQITELTKTADDPRKKPSSARTYSGDR